MLRISRPIWAGVLIGVVLTILSTGVFAFGLNETCRTRFFNSNAYQYPGAVEVARTSVFLGEQIIYYRTEDPADAVTSWYVAEQVLIWQAANEGEEIVEVPPPQYYYGVTGTPAADTIIMVWTTCPH